MRKEKILCCWCYKHLKLFVIRHIIGFLFDSHDWDVLVKSSGSKIHATSTPRFSPNPFNKFQIRIIFSVEGGIASPGLAWLAAVEVAN